MDHGDVQRLLRAGVEGLPERDLSAAVWARSQRRRRIRRTTAVLGAVTAASALVVVSAVVLGDDIPDQRGTPAPATSAPAPSTPISAARLCQRSPDDCALSGVVPSRIVQARWRPDRVATLPWLETNVPRSLDVDGAVSLSDDPVQAAVLAVERSRNKGGELFVLGSDRRWRLVDSPRLVPATDALGYGSGSLQSTSLSADGRMLAVPQPQSIVVIDLSTGDHRRYDVPGFNVTAIWDPDGEHVLTKTKRGRHGRVLDLRDGSLREVDYVGVPYATTYAPDGAAVELHEASGGSAWPWEMRTYGQRGTSAVALSVQPRTNFFTTTTAASADRLAFMRQVTGLALPAGPDRERRTGGSGPGDRATGANLAQLPMSYGLAFDTTPLGWVDDQTLLMRVGDNVLSWEFETGELQRIATMDGPGTLAAAPALIDRFGR